MKYKMIDRLKMDEESEEILTLLRKVSNELCDYVFAEDNDGNNVTIDLGKAFDIEEKVTDAFIKLGDFRIKYIGHL